MTTNILDRNRHFIKAGIIAVILLLLLIPTSFVQHLVQERSSLQTQVTSEVSSKWAREQTITGPVLMVPYNQHFTASDGKPAVTTKYAFFLPDDLRVSGSLAPEVRKRSLYEVALYRSRLSLQGSFKPLNIAKLGLADADMRWSEARLMMDISDVRGLEQEVVINWNGLPVALEPGVPDNKVIIDGMSAPIALAPGGSVNFSAQLVLKGSGHLYITPAAKSTQVDLSSAWKHPAFDGATLPSTHAPARDSGFRAQWSVLSASLPYPQQWKDAGYKLSESAFGVRLVQPTDSYAKTSRSVKYATLFIGLTFLVFFLLEIVQKRQVHPIQYVLVGLALVVFYTLLLSISEYLGFNPAYGIAAGATTALVAMYVWTIYRRVATALGFGAALGGLYTYIYTLLQLEDYALLFGSIGLFVILALLMYLTRKVDWYGRAAVANPE